MPASGTRTSHPQRNIIQEITHSWQGDTWLAENELLGDLDRVAADAMSELGIAGQARRPMAELTSRACRSP
eukprot:3065819-Rhodomonas_salina.1